MPAPISVVAPTLNSAQNLPGCAATPVERVEVGLIRELIVSDGGSVDGKLAVAGEIRAVLVGGPASRGVPLRRSCAAAQEDWISAVHSDTHLAPGGRRPCCGVPRAAMPAGAF